MAEVQWIKLYIDVFDKRKIKKLRRLPAGNDLLLIWVMLLVMAGKCNAGGMIFITESIPYTEEDLADELDFEVGTISNALKAFQDLDMISYTDDGYINIIGWEEYQNTDKLAEMREQTRKRVAKCRENKRSKSSNNECNVTETLQKPLRNAIEEDKDKEKESHSIILTREEAKLKYLGGTLGQGVVLLSDEQFDDLLDKLSLEEFNKYIGIVANCELKGKPYKKKTHYQAILDMVAKDRGVEKTRKDG
jgi:predicted phage replisome organizer